MIELRVHSAVSEIDKTSWNGLASPLAPPFLSWEWMSALEDNHCVGGEKGWLPHHLSLWEEGQLRAVAPAYLKGHSEGEFVFDGSWAEFARRVGVRYYPKLIVAVPFTPASGKRLLCAQHDEARLLPAFAAGLRQLIEVEKLSSAHVLFPEAEQAEGLASVGMGHRYGVQFQWHNPGFTSFEDFLGTLPSKKRTQIRRERRSMLEQGIHIETVTGRALTEEVVEAMFGFYLATVDKFAWGRRYLNRAFFEDVCDRLQDRVEIVLARDSARRPIAGAFNLVGGGVVYGRYWGASEERPFLHFNVCYYHTIEEAISRKLVRFEPGAGGDHKRVRGFAPTLTHSAHWVLEPRLDAAVRDFMGREGEFLKGRVAADDFDE